VGEKGLLARVDKGRKVSKGATEAQLNRIVDRPNLIARTGDRSGRGRAVITTVEVEADVGLLISIIDTLDEETKLGLLPAPGPDDGTTEQRQNRTFAPVHCPNCGVRSTRRGHHTVAALFASSAARRARDARTLSRGCGSYLDSNLK
jgi:hypothetical protein